MLYRFIMVDNRFRPLDGVTNRNDVTILLSYLYKLPEFISILYRLKLFHFFRSTGIPLWSENCGLPESLTLNKISNWEDPKTHIFAPSGIICVTHRPSFFFRYFFSHVRFGLDACVCAVPLGQQRSFFGTFKDFVDMNSVAKFPSRKTWIYSNGFKFAFFVFGSSCFDERGFRIVQFNI